MVCSLGEHRMRAGVGYVDDPDCSVYGCSCARGVDRAHNLFPRLSCSKVVAVHYHCH